MPVTDTPSRVLVVDDDPTVSEVVARYLERDGYAVETVADGRTALDRALADPPDLVVLDLMLPGIDGLEVCRRLRALAPVPIVILTARGQESDRIVGLDLGADDYVAKPFSTKELVARVRAVLRRANGPLAPSAPGAPPVYSRRRPRGRHRRPSGPVARAVVSLTAREFELLAFLVRHPRQAFRREELLEERVGLPVRRHVDGDRPRPPPAREGRARPVGSPVRIATVWGVGYRWEGVGPGAP